MIQLIITWFAVIAFVAAAIWSIVKLADLAITYIAIETEYSISTRERLCYGVLITSRVIMIGLAIMTYVVLTY